MTTTISGTTGVAFILADPIAQVRTPQGLNGIWGERGVDVVMVPAHVTAEGLEAFLDGMRVNASCVGAVLTIPHKQAAVPFCDELGPGATAAGAVNVIRRRADGTLYGETYDGRGFVAGLRDAGHDAEGVAAVVIGAGGAASAVAAALLDAGVGRLDIVNRSEQRAVELAERLRELYPGREIGVGTDRILDAGLVVNATSLGMSPDDPSPIDAELIPAGALAADVIIRDDLTSFLRAAEARGARVHGGRHMLNGQLGIIADVLTEGRA